MSHSVPGGPDNPVGKPKRRGRFLRILGFIGLGFLGFVGLVGGCSVLITQGVTTAGNQFLADLTGPDPALAWREAGPELQGTLDQAGFRRWVTDHGLQGGSVGFWNVRSRSDSVGTLKGTMTLRDGSTVPLRFNLRQNAAGLWQVIGVSLDDGARPDGGTKT